VNGWARARDYLELTKPRISLMVLVTVGVSIFIACSGAAPLTLLFHTLVGTALVAASASTWNQWIERDRDLKMPRTAERPLPAGRLGRAEVWAFGTSTLVAGVGYLWLTAGWQPACWVAITWLIYVGFYTPLKPLTSWNTVVGAVSGALPVVIGWSATGARPDARLATLFLLLFFWQFPHFMAIAWIYRRQYAEAGFRMVTVEDSNGRRAGWYAVACAFSVVLVTLLPALAGTSSVAYVVATLLLGLAQLLFAVSFLLYMNQASARHLLTASIAYLPMVLGLMSLYR
jgi:protoheme IX farnesyltransferase